MLALVAGGAVTVSWSGRAPLVRTGLPEHPAARRAAARHGALQLCAEERSGPPSGQQRESSGTMAEPEMLGTIDRALLDSNIAPQWRPKPVEEGSVHNSSTRRFPPLLEEELEALELLSTPELTLSDEDAALLKQSFDSIDYLGDWSDPACAKDSVVLCCNNPEVWRARAERPLPGRTDGPLLRPSPPRPPPRSVAGAAEGERARVHVRLRLLHHGAQPSARAHHREDAHLGAHHGPSERGLGGLRGLDGSSGPEGRGGRGGGDCSGRGEGRLGRRRVGRAARLLRGGRARVWQGHGAQEVPSLPRPPHARRVGRCGRRRARCGGRGLGRLEGGEGRGGEGAGGGGGRQLRRRGQGRGWG